MLGKQGFYEQYLRRQIRKGAMAHLTAMFSEPHSVKYYNDTQISFVFQEFLMNKSGKEPMATRDRS